MDRHLFLIQTPFQAFLCSKIIEQEGITEYDVLYISRHSKDDRYYENIAKDASRAFLFRHPINKGRISGYLKALHSLPLWLIREQYSKIHVSAIFVWYFRVLLRWHRAQIWTFDEGAGNYTGALSALDSKRDRIMSRLFGGLQPEEVLTGAAGHHAVRPDLVNIVPKEKLVPVRLMPAPDKKGEPITVIIGQNFHEYLSPENTQKIMRYFRDSKAIYFPHPREISREFEVIESDLIIEDFVLSQERPVTLLGGFSTALITIVGAQKKYIDADRNERRRAIMEAAGCEIIEI